MNIHSPHYKDLKACLQRLASINQEYIWFRKEKRKPQNKNLKFPYFQHGNKNRKSKIKKCEIEKLDFQDAHSELVNFDSKKVEKNRTKEHNLIKIFLGPDPTEKNRTLDSDVLGTIKDKKINENQRRIEQTINFNENTHQDEIENRENLNSKITHISPLRINTNQTQVNINNQPQIPNETSRPHISSVETTKRNISSKESQIFQESNNTNPAALMMIDSQDKKGECLLKKSSFKGSSKRMSDGSEDREMGDAFRQILDQSLRESGFGKVMKNRGNMYLEGYIGKLKKFRANVDYFSK